jgi:hypothetical protein
MGCHSSGEKSDASPEAGVPDSARPAEDAPVASVDGPAAIDVAASTDSASDVTAEAGVGGPGDYSCLGSVVWPAPTVAKRDIRLQVKNFQTEAKLAGLTVKACKKTDVTCASPEATGTTGADGIVALNVGAAAEGVDCYFEITGTGVAPTLLYLSFSDTKWFVDGAFNTRVLSNSTAQNLASLTTMDSSRGQLIFTTRDCADQPTPGVKVATLAADSQSKTLYMAAGVLSTTAIATDPAGAGIIANLPVGNSQVQGFFASNGRKIGDIPVLFRAGAFTSTNVMPTP